MKYWVTTHWPHYQGEAHNEPHSNVYIPDGRESSVKHMNPGDIVFIYESKSGRTELRHLIDGTTQHIFRQSGKEGIVTIARIATNVYEQEESEPSEYENGTKIWWRFIAETEHITSHGFISRAELNSVLGYDTNYNLRGFGDMHSGVKEINKKQGELLQQLFTRDIDNEIKNILDIQESNKIGYGSCGGSGEGEIHKIIKLAIQNNPELLLGEIGLKHIKTEYVFKTSDRVDLLLNDRFGKFIVVEVEPECLLENDIGAAQCMKYRSLFAYETNRSEIEVRTILAAPSIDENIIFKAKKYNIEVKIIDMHLTTAST